MHKTRLILTALGLLISFRVMAQSNAFEKTLEFAFLKPIGLPYSDAGVSFFAKRNKIPFMSQGANLIVRTYRVKNRAPLVLLFPGLGSDHTSDAANFLAERFVQSGYNVMIFPNNITGVFARGASRSGYPGVLSHDAKDMLSIVKWALGYAKRSGLRYTGLNVVGYSMGAALAAHVSNENSKSKYALPIRRVLLLNPPVNLQDSINRIESWTREAPGLSGSNLLSLSRKIRRFQTPHPSRESMQRMHHVFRLNSAEIKKSVSASLLLNFHKVVYTSQQIADLGIIKPSYKKDMARKYTASKVTIRDYMNHFIRRRFGKRDESSFRSFLAEQEVTSLNNHYRSNSSIYMIHNQDDIIINSAHLKSVARHFGNRAHIFKTGGHLGNMWEPVYLNKVLEFLD